MIIPYNGQLAHLGIAVARDLTTAKAKNGIMMRQWFEVHEPASNPRSMPQDAKP